MRALIQRTFKSALSVDGKLISEIPSGHTIFLGIDKGDTEGNVIYRSPLSTNTTVKSSSTRKYVCPCCHTSVRATKQVNIMCADCDEYMVEE